MTIKGEYEFKITIQNMFNTYTFAMKHHNLITETGLRFFTSKISGDAEYDNWRISKIITGDNSSTPSADDSMSKMEKGYIFTNSREFPVQPYSNKNRIIMTQQNVSGRYLNNTIEIGVIIEKETSDGENIKIDKELISRDTHPRINIPDTSIIEVNYMFTLTSNTKDDCTEN